jgi:hypothetical protein
MTPKNVDELSRLMLDLADEADAAGLRAQADGIAAVLPAIKVMKAAQYEGFQHYWIHNGRAFERAFVEKMKSKGKDFDLYDAKSAHEAWFEVLDEYQEGLMGNEEEFLEKYARKGKKEVEKSDTSGAGSSGATMSKAMTEFHDKLKNKAKDEGKSEGQAISEWLDSHKAACTLLTTRISEKLDDGSQPGVAFYEAMDEFLSGEWLADAVASIEESIFSVKVAAVAVGNEGLAKKAGIGDWWANMSNKAGKAWDVHWALRKAPVFKFLAEIKNSLHVAQRELKTLQPEFEGGVKLPIGVIIGPNNKMPTVNKLLVAIKNFFAEARKAGIGVPQVPDPGNYKDGAGLMDAARFQAWIGSIYTALDAAKDQTALLVARNTGKGHDEVAEQAAPSADMPEEKQYYDYIAGQLNEVAAYMRTTVTPADIVKILGEKATPATTGAPGTPPTARVPAKLGLFGEIDRVAAQMKSDGEAGSSARQIAHLMLRQGLSSPPFGLTPLVNKDHDKLIGRLVKDVSPLIETLLRKKFALHQQPAQPASPAGPGAAGSTGPAAKGTP